MSGVSIVVTGVGAVTAAGVGILPHLRLLVENAASADQRDLSLNAWSAASYLSDRRIMKSISTADAIGMVGIEDLRRHPGYDATARDAFRTGLYVGSPPARVNDNEYYLEAMTASQDASGRCSLSAFGQTCMSSRPTALLVGLPNNVLCYGSMLLDARGPNSNYTAADTGGQTAVINAAQRLRRGRLDYAVAGGFAAHGAEPYRSMFERVGIARRPGAEDGTLIADGAVFLALEPRQRAATRGAGILVEYVAGALASDGLGPDLIDRAGGALAGAIRRALTLGGVTPDEVGLVLATAYGRGDLDDAEAGALARVFNGTAASPAIGSTATMLGNLLEAGGLLELALVTPLYEMGVLPEAMRARSARTASAATIRPDKPYALITRVSPSGESSCILARTLAS